MPKLVIRQGGAVQRELPLAKDNFCIGRTPENDLEVKDSLISRRHSSIIRKGDRYIIYDLGSSNGTYVNREKVEMKVLDDGDIVRLGDTEITFNDERPRPKGTDAHAEPPAPADEGPPSRYIVQHVDDVAKSYSFDITDALQKGLSLRDIKKEVVGEKAAKESKMFFILFQVGKALSAAPTLEAMLQISMKLIFEVINAERGVMFTPGPDQALAPNIGFMRGKGIVPGADLHISSTITNQVVSEKVSIVTSDALQDPRFMQGVSIVQYNIRSALCVPLWEETRVYGAIYLDNLAKTYAFTRDDLDLLTAIANLIAMRIKQEELHEKLRREEILRNNLAKYHSPDVVEMLVSRGGDVGLEVSEREVTVLFADVESSTKLAEALGPNKLTELLNTFFEMATSAIFEHKGSVNKFIGDEVMAIWNAPLDQPGHALAAVKAAVKLIKEVERHNREAPEQRFNVRVGINTGTVVAGNVGTHLRLEYTVIGDSVNVAKRLTSFPHVNRVVIGNSTYEQVKGFFQVRDLGDTILKGREKSMRAYEIVIA